MSLNGTSEHAGANSNEPAIIDGQKLSVEEAEAGNTFCVADRVGAGQIDLAFVRAQYVKAGVYRVEDKQGCLATPFGTWAEADAFCKKIERETRASLLGELRKELDQKYDPVKHKLGTLDRSDLIDVKINKEQPCWPALPPLTEEEKSAANPTLPPPSSAMAQ